MGNDFQVVSAGDAVIGASLFLPAAATIASPVPVVMVTHGGGSNRRGLAPGESEDFTTPLLDAGYAIVTWDTRGHGESRSTLHGNPVFYEFGARHAEVEDVRAIVRMLANCGTIRQEGEGDPLVGMAGASNGGGIQINAAAAIREIDAITPTLFWGDLPEDVAPNGVPKVYGELIYEALRKGRVRLDPTLDRWHENVLAHAALGDDVRTWFGERSTAPVARDVRIPTLILQGTHDTLFPLEGAMRIYETIAAGGTPVKLVAYCAGHALQERIPTRCRYGTDPTQLRIDWFARHLRGEQVDTGPAIFWYGQDGTFRNDLALPANDVRVELTRSTARKKARRKRRTRRTRRVVRSLHSARARRRTRPRRRRVARAPLAVLQAPGGDGGDTRTFASPAPESENASTYREHLVSRPKVGCRRLFGIPRIRIVGSITRGSEAFLFAELQESNSRGARRTVNMNTMPVRVSGRRFDVTFQLHGTSWVVEGPHFLDLEVTTGSGMYLEPRRAATVRIDRIVTELPLGPVGRGRTC